MGKRHARAAHAASLLVALSLAFVACSDGGGTEPETDAGERETRDGSTGPRDAMTDRDASRGDDAAMGALDAGGGDGGMSTDPGRVETPRLPRDIALDPALPVDVAGRPIVGDTGTVTIVMDPEHVAGPLDALARCAARILLCESEDHTTDECVFSAPRCATSRPWEEDEDCCPTACWTTYSAQRAAGASADDAVENVLFGTPSCVDGVDAARRGEMP